jgi:hypothetical protein
MRKCGKCNEEKEDNFFYKHKKKGYQSYCKECNKLWVRDRYKRNKEYYDKKNKDNIKRNKKFVLDYLNKNPCIDCGESDPIVLDFDHIRDKKDTICKLIRKMCCIDRIIEEINKCEVRCANCHRRKTFKTLGLKK